MANFGLSEKKCASRGRGAGGALRAAACGVVCAQLALAAGWVARKRARGCGDNETQRAATQRRLGTIRC